MAWSADIGPAPLLGATVKDRTVFASTSDGVVHAIDVLDGSPVWNSTLGGRPTAPHAAADFVIVSGQTIQGLHPGNGTIAWKHPVTGSVWSPPFVRGDSIYVTKDDRLLSLSPFNGTQNWASAPLGPDLQMPASAQCCTVGVFTAGANEVFSRDMAAGNELWRHQLKGKVHRGPLAITNALVFAADDSGALDVRWDTNGSLHASASLGAGVVRGPTALANTVLFPLEDGNLARWHGADIKEVWRSPLGSTPATSAIPLYDHDWIATTGGKLLAFRDVDGVLNHSFDLGAPAGGNLQSFYGQVIVTAGSRLLAYDVMPLDFRIQSHRDNESVGTREIALSGSAYDDFFLQSIEVDNGSGWRSASAKFTKVGFGYRADWTGKLGLETGWNVLRARTVGNAGSAIIHREASIRVFLDESAPALNILSPVDGYVTANRSVTLTGTARDSNGLKSVDASTDLANWVPATGLENWSVMVGLKGGTYDVTVRATDLAGLYSLRSVRVTSILSQADTAPPSLWAQGNATRVYASSTEVAVTGGATDSVDVRRIDILAGGDWHRCEGTWRFECHAILAEGSHLISLRATDTSGNVAEIEIVVVVDLVPPVLRVDTPPAKAFTNRGSVVASGDAADGSGIANVVAHAPSGAKELTLIEGRFSSELVLLPGSNLIDFVATDLAGNVAKVETNVTQDAVAPTIGIDLVQPGTGVTKLFGSAADEVGLDRVEASGDGGSTWVTATGRDSWFVTLDGNPSEVVVRAVDLAGNEARAAWRAPGAMILSPAAVGVLLVALVLLPVGIVIAMRARPMRRPPSRHVRRQT